MKNAVPVQNFVKVDRFNNITQKRWFWGVVSYGSATLVLLLSVTVFILAMGHSPLVSLQAALKDSLLTIGGLSQTLNRTTPLLLGSLAFSICARAGLSNIGIDGQIYAGAILSTGMGLVCAKQGLSMVVALPLVLVVGMVGGLLYVSLAGILRVKWGVSEIFSTVMLNFIALLLVEFLATGVWNDPMAGEAITLPIARSAVLPKLLPSGGAHIGFLIAAVLAFGVWFLMYRTRLGYEIRAIGSNPRAAMFGGIDLTRVQLLAFSLAGLLAGLAGAIEITGVHERLLLGLTPNYGIMSILISVVGRFHPIALVPVSFAFGILVAGSDSLQRTADFPSSAVFMVQGLAVLIVLILEAIRDKRERFTV